MPPGGKEIATICKQPQYGYGSDRNRDDARASGAWRP